MTDLDNNALIAHYEALRRQASQLDRDIAAVRREIKRRQRMESRLFNFLSKQKENVQWQQS
jgi:prefoldin subunit 5